MDFFSVALPGRQMAGGTLQGRRTQTLFIAGALSILWAPKGRWRAGRSKLLQS